MVVLREFRYFYFCTLLILIVACSKENEGDRATNVLIGVEHLQPNTLFDSDKIEVLADGFEWTEGPLWLPDQEKLIFSDIPRNRIFEWSGQSGKKEYLNQSGYTGNSERGGELGSNGLLLDNLGRLVLCQHGDRRIARMNVSLDDPGPIYTTIADQFNNKRLNSPNDATYDSQGNLYFTDPPYGLEYSMDDPSKELNYQGVFMLTSSDSLILLSKELTRPNGIALSPDERKLYVANSDPKHAIWMVYNLNASGTISRGKIFYDATQYVGKEGEKGLPDGMKISINGTIYATGPGGVWVFHPDGVVLAKIRTGQATSNVAFGPNEKSLFITADNYLMRVMLN